MPQGPPPTHPHVRPILIVDDVASEALTLRLLCQSLGVDAVTTASPAEAAAILLRLRPAGIITDLVMPGADGLDCLYMIAGHAPTVPVMVVTASEKLLLKAASELGDVYGLADLVCVAKPVDVPTLQAFVARAGAPSRPPRAALH
jgi:two-component system response regulator (stage 0 sporulation protein F)